MLSMILCSERVAYASTLTGVTSSGVYSGMFGPYIMAYLYLAGAGGGAYIVSAILDIFDKRDLEDRGNLLSASQAGYIVATACFIVACLLLFFDLGSPALAFTIFLHPTSSILSIGAYILVITIGISGFCSVAPFIFRQMKSGMIILKICGMIMSFSAITYTGVFLASVRAVDFWNTPLLVVLFIVSSLVCGVAIVVLVENFSAINEVRSSRLGMGAAFLSVIELLVLLAFILSRWFFSDVSRASCEMLFTGDLGIVFWVGLIVVGVLMPITLHFFGVMLNSKITQMGSSIAALVGGFCLRYCVIGAAIHTSMLPVV